MILFELQRRKMVMVQLYGFFERGLRKINLITGNATYVRFNMNGEKQYS